MRAKKQPGKARKLSKYTPYELHCQGVAEGRFNPNALSQLCDVCGEWIAAIAHRTLDGTEMCWACAVKLGAVTADVVASEHIEKYGPEGLL